ncbi:MAG: hypothetical protein IKU71_10135, partial [Kiritimatiellae bacterium]|nr:hypothetical protein [Kiritimatiellia bacterium]
ISRIEAAVRAGYTIMSGFISPGETAVRDRLLANGSAKLVHVLPSGMNIGHRPDSRYLPLMTEGRFLEIAEGNDETEFSRNACLSLNDAIAAIATAGAGGALYWREDGPKFTAGL